MVEIGGFWGDENISGPLREGQTWTGLTISRRCKLLEPGSIPTELESNRGAGGSPVRSGCRGSYSGQCPVNILFLDDLK